MADEIPTSDEMLAALKDDIIPVLTGFYTAYRLQEAQLTAARSLLQEAGARLGMVQQHMSGIRAFFERYPEPRVDRQKQMEMRALLSTIISTLSPLDAVGTCKFCGNQDCFDQYGFIHEPECPWKQAWAMLETGKGSSE